MKKPPQPAVTLIEQTELFELGTGTDGPAPRLKPVLIARKASLGPPRPVSYRVALRQITGTVLEALNERGEQWNADARQDLISTLFIAAHKAKALIFDFQPEAEPDV